MENNDKSMGLDDLNYTYHKQGRAIVEYIRLFGIQHIAEVPTYEELVQQSWNYRRKSVKAFGKFMDSKILEYPLIKKPLSFCAKILNKLITLLR